MIVANGCFTFTLTVGPPPTTPPPVGPCKPGEAVCSDGVQCIPADYRCDGDVDCRDGSDENCPSKCWLVGRFLFPHIVNMVILDGGNFAIVSWRCYAWLQYSQFKLICFHTCDIMKLLQRGIFCDKCKIVKKAKITSMRKFYTFTVTYIIHV